MAILHAERIHPAAAAQIQERPGPPPLTHHEILRLAEAFSRAGRSVDMQATDRIARQLVFRRRSLLASGAMPAVQELAVLDAASADHLALERDVVEVSSATSPTSQRSTLHAEGAPAATLLAWVDAVPPERQWQQAAGQRIALGHKLLAPLRGQTEPTLTLVRASAHVAGLAVTMTVSRVKNVPAEIDLRPASGQHDAPATLPEDLLSVLGLDWSRLSRHSGGWRATLRLRGGGAARGLDAEAKFRRGIEHLAAVLAAPPAAFHAQFKRARWGVSLRRAVPALVCVGLIGAAAAVPLLKLGSGSVFRMLIFNAPPILLVWLFAMRELPRIEIPPLPRPLPDTAWTARRT